MLSGCSNLNALNLSHKAVFYFLYNLYQSCQYIQSTYRNSLQDGILSKLKDRMRLPPTLQSTPIMIMWTRTILVTQLAEPASCDINQLGTTLNSNPKMNGFTFICEALSLTCTPSGLSWQKIIALAKLVAEICCICHTVPPGILAALIALSLPYDTSYGFQQLATSANVRLSLLPSQSALMCPLCFSIYTGALSKCQESTSSSHVPIPDGSTQYSATHRCHRTHCPTTYQSLLAVQQLHSVGTFTHQQHSLLPHLTDPSTSGGPALHPQRAVG